VTRATRCRPDSTSRTHPAPHMPPVQPCNRAKKRNGKPCKSACVAPFAVYWPTPPNCFTPLRFTPTRGNNRVPHPYMFQCKYAFRAGESVYGGAPLFNAPPRGRMNCGHGPCTTGVCVRTIPRELTNWRVPVIARPRHAPGRNGSSAQKHRPGTIVHHPRGRMNCGAHVVDHPRPRVRVWAMFTG
jgi:hypothetical protein